MCRLACLRPEVIKTLFRQKYHLVCSDHLGKTYVLCIFTYKIAYRKSISHEINLCIQSLFVTIIGFDLHNKVVANVNLFLRMTHPALLMDIVIYRRDVCQMSQLNQVKSRVINIACHHMFVMVFFIFHTYVLHAGVSIFDPSVYGNEKHRCDILHAYQKGIVEI